MSDRYLSQVRDTLEHIRADGFYKTERVIASPQSPAIRLADGAEVLNFCANNYLGLADDPRLVAAAKEALDRYGYGMASVRFICGTQDVHKELEAALAAFLGSRRLHPLLELLRRQRRPLRDAAGRRGRGGERRAQPREHRRRHPPVQGEALPLPQQRHGATSRRSSRKPRPPARASSSSRPTACSRWTASSRTCSAICDLARAPRRAHHGRRLARGRLRGRGGPRHAGALRRRGADRHPHRHARQGDGRRLGRLHRRPARDRGAPAPALAPLPLLQLARARASPRPRSRS